MCGNSPLLCLSFFYKQQNCSFVTSYPSGFHFTPHSCFPRSPAFCLPSFPLLPHHPETHTNLISALIVEIILVIRPFILVFIECQPNHAGTVIIPAVNKTKFLPSWAYGESDKKWKNNPIHRESVRLCKMLWNTKWGWGDRWPLQRAEERAVVSCALVREGLTESEQI